MALQSTLQHHSGHKCPPRSKLFSLLVLVIKDFKKAIKEMNF